MEGKDEIDRELVRKLFKSMKIWETLRQIHNDQYEKLKFLEEHVVGGEGVDEKVVNGKMTDGKIINGIWFKGLGKQSNDTRPSPAKAPLERLREVGKTISDDLVKESRDLIDRVRSSQFYTTMVQPRVEEANIASYIDIDA